MLNFHMAAGITPLLERFQPMLHYYRTDMWTDHMDCGGWFWSSPSGSVVVCLNPSRGDFHVSALDDAGPQEVLETLERLRDKWDLHLLDTDECEPVLLPSGAVQLYLTTSAWDMPEALSLQQDRRSA